MVFFLSQLYPESIVPIPSSNEQVHLVNNSFGKISHMVSDGSWVVRVQAAKTGEYTHTNHSFTSYFSESHGSPFLPLLSSTHPSSLTQGNMLQVSPHFLEQTLDKKLMSDLRAVCGGAARPPGKFCGEVVGCESQAVCLQAWRTGQDSSDHTETEWLLKPSINRYTEHTHTGI
uniref:Uncharacterized protein n=1 Tax=Hucho hucho TaxID=62062 RepID=A0A4W5M5G7_9TELE